MPALLYADRMAKITRREFVVQGASLIAAAEVIAKSPIKTDSRPNILFILADDMGWGDLSCYGRPDYRTPNLDKLALEGVRFTNAYSAAPVCTPTRVGHLTGRYPARLAVGLEEPIVTKKILGERAKTIGIPHEHATVSSILKEAGYETSLIGKWHLGFLPDFGPLNFGFDKYFGILGGAGDYFSHKDPSGEADLFEGDVPIERTGYLTDLLTDHAIESIKRPRQKPFYISLHYTAPHWPWEGPSDKAVSDAIKYDLAGFRGGGSTKVYGEMMESLDAGIGRVLAALRSTGHDKNTLVIFTSDNGGEGFSYHWPFTGQKMDLHEGGIRVPAIVRWPGITRRGTVSEQPNITMDWTATMIAVAGAKPSPDYPLDGEDMRTVLTGERSKFDRTFFWRTRRQCAVRHGKWKYLREGEKEFLFDLSVDEREQADFKNAEPRVISQLRDEFNKWNAGVLPYQKV